MQKNILNQLFFLIAIVFLLSACEPKPSPTPTTPFVPPTKTSVPTTATFTETPTLTSTLTSTITATSTTTTSTPTDTPTITLTPTRTAYVIPENAIMAYFTIIGTGGPVACGDSLYAIYTGRDRTGSVEEDIRIALDAIFSSGQYVGALYNATYLSSFKVGDVSFNISNGTATISLAGIYVKPESYCDARRFRDQVWATARRFPEVKRAVITVRGGALLGDLLYAIQDK